MTASVLKMQRELVAVTEERDRLAAELQKMRDREAKQKPVAMVDAGDDGYFAEILPDCSVGVGDMLYAFPPLNVDPVLWQQSFDQWWDAHGQYLRAGGGQYEKTFAYHAWEAAAAFYAAPIPAPAVCKAHETECSTCKNDISKCVSVFKPAPSVIGDALLQKQKAFDELCQLWTPVYNYARNHPDITLGESIVGFALELMRKADALREQKPVAMISQNDAGQISIKNHDGTFFDMSKHVGCQFYAAPVAAPAVPGDSAYLLERQENGLSWYVSAATRRGSGWHWTADVNSAIRFSREKDAAACWNIIARHHAGIGGSGTTEVTPKQHIFEDARALLQSAGGAK